MWHHWKIFFLFTLCIFQLTFNTMNFYWIFLLVSHLLYYLVLLIFTAAFDPRIVHIIVTSNIGINISLWVSDKTQQLRRICFLLCGFSFLCIHNKDIMCHLCCLVILLLLPSINKHILKSQDGALIISKYFTKIKC